MMMMTMRDIAALRCCEWRDCRAAETGGTHWVAALAKALMEE